MRKEGQTGRGGIVTKPVTAHSCPPLALLGVLPDRCVGHACPLFISPCAERSGVGRCMWQGRLDSSDGRFGEELGKATVRDYRGEALAANKGRLRLASELSRPSPLG